MKKLLFVMTGMYNGGAERSLVNLLNEIPEDKYKVDLLLFKREGLFLNQIPEYVNIIEPSEAMRRLYGPISRCGSYLPVKLLGNAVSRIREHRRSSARAYRWHHWYSRWIPNLETHYDTAIAFISGEVLFYLDEKVSADKKLVWIHNDYRAAHHPKKYDYAHLNNMDGIVSISEQCVKILKEEFPEFQDKIHYLPNITSSSVIRRRADEFIPAEYRADRPSILSVGRLTPQKGFDLAIQAAAEMKNRGILFDWYVIGDGELHDELESQIKSLCVEDCFHLLGTRENPYPYMKHCSVLAQTSRFEGKSMVLDEAKILAVPILVTDYPTVGDQIIDGQEGIVANQSIAAISDCMIHLLQDEKTRCSISEFLSSTDYGNQDEIVEYFRIID